MDESTTNNSLHNKNMKRKIDDPKRKFHGDWTDKFFESENKPIMEK